ncbi:hypothetical protein MRX96_057401 [Rhipicephalus microplus]
MLTPIFFVKIAWQAHSPLDNLALPSCDLHPLVMPSCGLHLTVTRRRTGSMRKRTSPPQHHRGFITNLRPT